MPTPAVLSTGICKAGTGLSRHALPTPMVRSSSPGRAAPTICPPCPKPCRSSKVRGASEMSVMTPGKVRHLAQCSSPAGHFVVLAIDHRGNLRNSLNEHALRSLTDDEFTAFKQQIIQHLTPAATAVLTDPDHGMGPGLASGALTGQVGILTPLEVTDYTLPPNKRITNWIDG